MAILEAIHQNGGKRRYRVKSPLTLEPVGEFECADEADVKAAVARARAAQKRWGVLSLDDRTKYLQRVLDLVVNQQERIIETIRGETGRSVLETYFMEIFAVCDSINYYSRNAKKILSDRGVGLHLLRMKKAKIAYRPLGVVGIITPWNGPFVLSMNPTVQALMAGNAVVIKPSEVTPFSGKLVEDLMREAGLPDGLVQVVLGDGATGAALLEAGVDKISFTGSVNTGRKVGEACGRNLIPCTLELGGKDPMIICEDADLERAAGGAVFGAFMNAGQYCSSTERVYVVDAVADRFISMVQEKVKALTVGKEGDYDIGPFIFEKQLDTVDQQVQDAIAKGATVLHGGKRAEALGPYFYEPTLLTDVTHDMAIMREETFGPVLPIMRCANELEAIRLANDTHYGLGASLWTKDKGRAQRLASRLEAGGVCVNDASVTYGALELPFGGWKTSGVGQVNGADGLRAYCHAQPVISGRYEPTAEQIWYPYSSDKLDGLRKAVKVLWGTPLKRLMR